MIFLTGATGMLGSHIAFGLTSGGRTVRALKRSSSSLAMIEKIFRLYSADADSLLARIEWVTGDLLDLGSLEDAMEGVTHVYHCAAVVSFHPEDRGKLLQTNIEGTANVINTALDAGVQKFCHISSVAALGRTTNGRTIDEQVWWKTSPENSWYAISKYGGEREAWRASEEGMDVIILNPSLILGPGNGVTSSSEMFTALKKGMRWYTDGISGYVDARDVAAAAVQLMDSPIRNERFVVNAANLSFREFFDKVLQQFGQPATRYHAGPLLTSLARRGDQLRSAITGNRTRLTKEMVTAALLVNRFDGKKITGQLGFRYRDIDTTIREMCGFYQD